MSCIEQLSLYDKPSPMPPALAVSHLNEIRLSGNAQLGRALLAGMLMELSGSSDQRWLCWVAEQPLKPLLDAGASLRGQRILQVVAADRSALCQITVRALERGKSHTVAVLLEGELDSVERGQLEAAASAGGAQCLIIYRS